MDAVVVLLAPVLLLVGAWTVTHPNGGYRAVGGAGSGFSPGTRRFLGVLVMIVGALLMFADLPR